MIAIAEENNNNNGSKANNKSQVIALIFQLRPSLFFCDQIKEAFSVSKTLLVSMAAPIDGNMMTSEHKWRDLSSVAGD